MYHIRCSHYASRLSVIRDKELKKYQSLKNSFLFLKHVFYSQLNDRKYEIFKQAMEQQQLLPLRLSG